MDLVWNVYRYDVNRNEIVTYNVFSNYGFVKSCVEVINKYKNDIEKIKEEIKHTLVYYYWSKCEWEILISPLFSRDGRERKIDVYSQIMLNWDKFFDYLWTNIEMLCEMASKK